jgi:hypothetical protein
LLQNIMTTKINNNFFFHLLTYHETRFLFLWNYNICSNFKNFFKILKIFESTIFNILRYYFRKGLNIVSIIEKIVYSFDVDKELVLKKVKTSVKILKLNKLKLIIWSIRKNNINLLISWIWKSLKISEKNSPKISWSENY